MIDKKVLKELVEKAEKLGINVDDYEEEDALQDAVDDAEEKEKEKENDLDFWKAEAKKAFADRDKAKKERRLEREKLKKRLKDSESKLDDLPDADDFETMKAELEELKNFKKEADEKLEEEELKTKTDVEKTQLRMKKEIEAIESKFSKEFESMKTTLTKKEEELAKKEKDIESLREIRLKSEIVDTAAKLKAFNPNQVFKIMKDEFTYDSDLDRFGFYERDGKGKLVDEKSVSERVEEFLNDPDNGNLVKADVKPGTGHEDRQDVSKKKNISSDSKYDPDDEEIKMKADEDGLSVEDYIEIQEFKDKRLGKADKDE